MTEIRFWHERYGISTEIDLLVRRGLEARALPKHQQATGIKMHIMTTKDLKSGHELNHLNTKSFLDKFAGINTNYFEVLEFRLATFNDMQAEVERLEGHIRMNEMSLQDAPMHGGYHNKLNISTSKTKIINLNAAIRGIAEDKLAEESA